ncbi:unnamed protein product [Malus baccata var. baccata]
MIFLAETKMKDHRINGVRRRMGFLNGFNVTPVGRAGGLSLWWDDSLDVEILFSSKHIIDARVMEKGAHRWVRVTGIYGTPYRCDKGEFWNWMSTYFSPSDMPWLCAGDFNEFLWDSEKVGGSPVLYNRPRYLESFLSSSELLDLDFNGPAFTWRGMRNGSLVEERLDRGLCNRIWQDVWPNTTVTHGTVLGSDHCPIIIQTEPNTRKGKKLFRFEAFWAKEADCLEVVRRSWDCREGGGAQVRWQKKINDCRSQLIRWSRNKFKRRSYMIDHLLAQLGELQKNWGPQREEILEKSKLIDTLWAQEESFWQQRSRVKWLKEGDANTKFFHQTTLQRRRRNKVLKIRNSAGDWVENPTQVRRLVDEHFLNSFRSEGDRNWGTMLDCLNPMVTEEMNAALMAPVLEEEIKTAALGMGGLKAPGPDGFQGVFYHTFWENIVGDVNDLVYSMIMGQDYPRNLNSTHIVLIPKVQNPEMVSQFRPISLCNYSYKILSKVLANRLKPILTGIISPMQNAFVAGRQIQDNIGIAHEVFHFLKTRKAKRRFEVGIKLDMQKAYDRVEWDFLDAVMERMGFGIAWRKLIMGCVSSVNFAVLLNGQPGEKFAPSRGLRQGDPLSPYLFLLVGEVLSRLIQGAVERRQLDGVKLSGAGPIISHIFFADDTLIFLKADTKNCNNLVALLKDYCKASGQAINMQKSSVFFGNNVPSSLSEELGNILGMPVVDNPGSYLGVPALWGRSKKLGLAYVKGRILGKLQGWKQSMLSRAGKEVLIKAVVQAIPAYPMNIFKFPATLCKQLDVLIAKFWWGDSGERRKIHWVSMETLGLPKHLGGMGFRNFQEFNDALLAKQCWRLIADPDSLWAQVMKARYFPNCSFLDASKGGRASWAWSSLLVGRELILNGAHWQIMGGEEVRLWVDRWLPALPSGHPSPVGEVAVTRNTRVSSIICSSSRTWDFAFLLPFLSEGECAAISNTPIGNPQRKDRLIWAPTRNGNYSVKSGYLWLQLHSLTLRDHRSTWSRAVPELLWKGIWRIRVPPKVRNFLWSSLHNALATVAVLFRRRSSPTPICPICLCQEESIVHLFLSCPWVLSIWSGGALKYNIQVGSLSTWGAWLLDVFTSNLGSSASKEWVLTYVAFTCWHIWKSRCDFVFNQVHIIPSKIILGIELSVADFLNANSAPEILRAVDRGLVRQPGRWIPPVSPFVKLNVDASWSRVSKAGFAAVVARDARGEFIAAVRYPIFASCVAMAEALALLRGCELAVSLNISSVILESDSLESISCLSNSLLNGNWEAYPFLASAWDLGESFQDCRWSWVPRSTNLATDSLASFGNLEMCNVVWVNRPPSSLVFVLNNDGLPCPH